MLIREYRTRDFEQVMDLWKETGIYTLERGDTAEIMENCKDQGGQILVLEAPLHGKILGTAWLSWDGRRVFLHHFAVGPEVRRQGWGRKLMEEAMNFARSKNSPIKLEVHKDNIAAVRLYESMGFHSFPGYKIYMNTDP